MSMNTPFHLRQREFNAFNAANPAVFFAAADLGLTGTELPDAIEAMPGMMARLDGLRRAAGVRMGLAATEDAVGLAAPRIAILAPPAEARLLDGTSLAAGSHDIQVRMLSMGRVHRAVPLTGALPLAVACRITGSLAHALCGPTPRADEIRVAQPSGMLAVGAEVRREDGGWHAQSGVIFRTARSLMKGAVALRA
jgi:2-methylaconitate cis-trans-isomerase PrpF